MNAKDSFFSSAYTALFIQDFFFELLLWISYFVVVHGNDSYGYIAIDSNIIESRYAHFEFVEKERNLWKLMWQIAFLHTRIWNRIEKSNAIYGDWNQHSHRLNWLCAAFKREEKHCLFSFDSYKSAWFFTKWLRKIEYDENMWQHHLVSNTEKRIFQWIISSLTRHVYLPASQHYYYGIFNYIRSAN